MNPLERIAELEGASEAFKTKFYTLRLSMEHSEPGPTPLLIERLAKHMWTDPDGVNAELTERAERVQEREKTIGRRTRGL